MTRKCAVALVVPLLLAGLLAVPAWASQPSVAAPLFSVSPTALNFGSVVVGASSHSQSITITNISGSTLTGSDAVGVADAFVGVSRCSGKVLRSGRSCHWTYKFTPKALGFVQEETDGTLNGQSYALTFTGTGLPTRRIRFTSNLITSGTDLVPFSFQIDTVSVPTAVLSVSSPLPAGLTFVDEGNGDALIHGTPTVTGSFVIPVTATTPTREQSEDVHLTLNPAQFSIAPTTINFGSVPVGTTSPAQTVTVTNISGSTKTVFTAGGGTALFGGTTNCQDAVLAANQSCQYFYAFSPGALGFVQEETNGTLNGQPFVLSFTGTGT